MLWLRWWKVKKGVTLIYFAWLTCAHKWTKNPFWEAIFSFSLSLSITHTTYKPTLQHTQSLFCSHLVSLTRTCTLSHINRNAHILSVSSSLIQPLSLEHKCALPARTLTHAHAHPHSNLYQYITFTHMQSSSLFFFPIQARCVKIKMYLSECHQKTSHFSISINQYNARLHFDTSPLPSNKQGFKKGGERKL